MPKFQIRTLALLTLLVAMGLCWHRGHVARTEAIDSLRGEIKSIETELDLQSRPFVFTSCVTITR